MEVIRIIPCVHKVAAHAYTDWLPDSIIDQLTDSLMTNSLHLLSEIWMRSLDQAVLSSEALVL